MEHKNNYHLNDLPEFQRFARLNPGKTLGAQEAVLTYCGAIHWFCILESLNLDFQPNKYYSIEIAYLFTSDPDKHEYPEELYKQMQALIAAMWRKRLSELYLKGNWTIDVRDDPELTIEVYVDPRTCSKEVEFGLYYFNARWYDSLKRWASPDSIVPMARQGVQALDRYAYVNNSPVKYADASAIPSPISLRKPAV